MPSEHVQVFTGLLSLLGTLLVADADPAPGWVGGVAGLIGGSVPTSSIIWWLLYKYIPREQEKAAKAQAEEKKQLKDWVADKTEQIEQAEKRCEVNTKTLISTLREEAEKDRATFVRITDLDRELYRKNTDQTLEILRYLAEQERRRATAPCANYRPAKGNEHGDAGPGR